MQTRILKLKPIELKILFSMVFRERERLQKQGLKYNSSIELQNLEQINCLIKEQMI